MANYSFDYDNTDDGSSMVPSYLGQAMQNYGTDKNSPLPSDMSYPLNNQPGQSMFGGGGQFNMPPMDQAMQPDTPLGKAMDTSTPSYYNPQPQAPQEQNFMQRMAARPDSRSIADGLIKGGAGMLGAKNLQEGLAANLTGFSDAYDARTDKTREENTPKVTDVAGGAFASVQYPGKEPVLMKRGEVAKYLTEQEMAKEKAKIAAMQLQGVITNQNHVNTEARAQVDKAQAGLDSIKETITKLREAGPAIERYGNGHRAAAAGGPLGNAIGGAFDPQIAVDNQLLGELNVQGILDHVKQLPGSASDNDVRMLSQNVPRPGAAPEVVRDWHRRALEAADRLQAKYEANMQRGQGNQGQAPTPQPTRSTSQAGTPITQEGYASLKSGETYLAPDGHYRTKK